MNLITKASGFLSGFTIKFWLIVCAVLIACMPLAYCKGVSDGKAMERGKWEQATREAQQRARQADEGTNRQRQADTERNIENANRREDAARDGGRLSANCERLRQAGIDTPPACN